MFITFHTSTNLIITLTQTITVYDIHSGFDSPNIILSQTLINTNGNISLHCEHSCFHVTDDDVEMMTCSQ